MQVGKSVYQAERERNGGTHTTKLGAEGQRTTPTVSCGIALAAPEWKSRTSRGGGEPQMEFTAAFEFSTQERAGARAALRLKHENSHTRTPGMLRDSRQLQMTTTGGLWLH